MKITYDDTKNARNIAERGLPFTMVAELDWNQAVIVEDDRRDYGERRLRVLAFIEDRLYVAVVTFRGNTVHVISFRKANSREVTQYGNQKA